MVGLDVWQWCYFFENDVVCEYYCMIVYDFFYYGKLVFFDGWWECEYKFIKFFLLSFVMIFVFVFEFERLVYMGSLIGGYLVFDFVLYYLESF